MPKSTSKPKKTSRPRRRSGGEPTKLIEALITGLVAAVVAAALMWVLWALLGLDRTSWHSGLASGMVAGMALTATTGPAVRRVAKKALA